MQSKFYWNPLKSRRLKQTRGASFEDIVQSHFIKVMDSPQRSNQKIALFYYQDYIWAIPYIVVSDDEIFLKTLYRCRKYTKMYRRGEL